MENAKFELIPSFLEHYQYYPMKKGLLLLLLVNLWSITAIWANFSLQKLQVNYQTQPLGTDLGTPQFSWQMKALSSIKGLAQVAYQIKVVDEKNQEVWQSTKVSSDVSHAIQYQGKPLQARTRYTWFLTVWDNKGKSSTANSWFETGLMNPKQEAWGNAKWIGGGDEDLVFYPHALSVFKLSYAIQLDEASNSSKASFIFGANDQRLSNRFLNHMGVERKKNESYIAIELDISTLSAESNTNAKLNIYRVGYTKTDQENIPFKVLTIPQSLINQSNKYQKHQIFTESIFGLFEFYLDGNDETHKLKDPSLEPNSRFGPRGLNLNPVGAGNDYLSYPMLADMGFKVADKQKAYFSDITVKNYRYPSNAIFKDTSASIFSGIGVTKEGQRYRVENTLATTNTTQNAEPMLRTTFDVSNKKIQKARLYITARGIYESYLNGKRVSNDFFNPGLTQYNKNHTYQTFDITSSISTGKNALGAWLSEGWWSGNITYSGNHWNFFGDRQSLLAKIIITYADGSEQVIDSNPITWKLNTDGPIRYGSFFQGETYDASKEADIQGWTLSNYDDKSWKKAVEVPLEGNSYMGTFSDVFGQKSTFDYKDFKLIGQIGENASIVKTLQAQSVEEVRPKVFVYDMGQNMVGFPQIQIKNGQKGQVITMRYAEIKYPNLDTYKGNEGMIMMENIRAALTTDQYILKGGDEVIQPRFTFHGYRYLEITGIPQAIPVGDIKGLVISSVNELSSSYETSDPLVNKLWQNITWSLRSNFLSIPTDTPARNERMGWSGDISVFSKTATYLTDANSFLRRHLLAMRDVQDDNGRFTDVAPLGGGFGGTLWGSAGIVVAWETYRQYGDIQLLGEHFDAMKKYINFLESKIDKNTGILNEGPLGDWLSPEGNKNDNTLFWMAYFSYDLNIMSQMASILGKTDEAIALKKRSEEIKKAFNDIYIDKNSHRTVRSGLKTGFWAAPNEKEGTGKTDKGVIVDTQASYAIPLALDVFDEANKPFAIKYLNEAVSRTNNDDSGIERPNYSLMTGFIGTASISEALSVNGNHDLAYKLLTNKQYPSWLYSVVNGATSIWERLNSYTVENGFGGNNSMNSFNHYSFGAVAAWMYNYSLGIQRHPQKAGFKEFILMPTPDPNGQITEAKGHYDSMYGRINSAWKSQQNTWTYSATVPANSTATLYLPAKSVAQISENGKSLSTRKGVKSEKGFIIIPLESGSYNFEIKK